MTTLADPAKTIRRRQLIQTPVQMAGTAMAQNAGKREPQAAKTLPPVRAVPAVAPKPARLSVFETELLTAWAAE